LVNEVVPSRSPGEPGLLSCGRIDLDCGAAKLTVAIPTGFTEMLAADPGLALEWRLATRRIFGTYLGRGYRVVGFSLDRGAPIGTYLLERRS
jgi:predicted GNAT superfamily acetyltransferase